MNCVERCKVGLTLFLLLGGCSSQDIRHEPSMKGQGFVGPKLAFSPTACEFSNQPKSLQGAEELAPLVGLLFNLVPAIADSLVSFTSSYLQKVGQEYSATTTQTTSIPLRSSTEAPIVGCLEFIYGTYNDVPATNSTSTLWTAERLNKFGLAEPPKIYAEWWLVKVDKAGNEIAFVPGSVQLLSPISKRTSSKNQKDLAFAIQFERPAAAAPKVPVLPSAPPPVVQNAAPSPGIVPSVVANAVPAPDATPAAARTANQHTPRTRSVVDGTPPPRAAPAVGAVPKPGAASPLIAPAHSGASPAAVEADKQAVTTTIPAKDEAVAGFAFSFPGVAIGTSLGERALSSMRSPAQPMNAATDPVLNVQVTVVESEDGGDFLLMLSKFISDQKTKISPPVEDMLTRLIRSVTGQAPPAAATTAVGKPAQ